jgi:flagellar biosynthesis anti-sigma factor FlgM
MRVPESKGISPYSPSAPREVATPAAASVSRSQRDPQRQTPEQGSVEVRLSSRVTNHATYLQMLKALPDVRSDRVEEVRRKLSGGNGEPDSSRIADAILAHHVGLV